MDPNILDYIKQISLMAEEMSNIAIQHNSRDKILEDCSLSLLGHFLTERPFNKSIAKNLLRASWKLGNNLKIVDVVDDIFQFRFKLKSQMEWVLNKGLWSFENHLLVVQRWERGLTTQIITFPTIVLWVQV